MSRRRASIGLAPILSALTADDSDAAARIVLDATESLLRDFGLRRWSVDDVADRAGVGRTSVYRRFQNRDDLVHAVLARELRRTIAAIGVAAELHPSPEDKVVAAALAALRALRDSVVDSLLRTDPGTVLPFLTTNAGPLVAIARDALATQVRAADPSISAQRAAVVGEAAARLGLSFILTRDTVLPLDDDAAGAAAIRALVAPMLGGRRRAARRSA
jgi:AcrR family transcriptional regulator